MTAKEDLVEPSHGQQPTTTTMENPDQTDIDILDPQQPPPDYQSSILNENDDNELDDDNLIDDNGEPIFPTEDLVKLEEQVTRPRWIVPVLSDGELIKCLRSAVRLARNKLDIKSEPCQRFIRDSLVNSFLKIFCDDAVQSWKFDIYLNIYKNTMIFIHLCVLKLDDDCLSLHEVLSFVVNPLGRFHQANHNRQCLYHSQNETEPFASLVEYRLPQRGWLVDFINKFGDLNGFDKLLARFLSSENKLTISLLVALLKPWGLCYEYLTQSMIKKYFAPIIEFVPQFLDQLTENDFKIESKGESKSDTLSAVIKWLRHLASRLPENDQACRTLDALRLKIILRLLQTNSFSGKMNALNEVNKLLPNLNSIHRSTLNDDGLTSDKFIEWIKEHEILDIVLRDCLHQPQYVEKLEKPLRFMIKEQALTRHDLAKIWHASYGKHEAIEKNIHDLLAKLAWDFSPEQLEQLFDCFRESWTKANNKQREKLLELIRRLAEDDKEGLMANKVLELLWTLSHDKDLPNEIVDQALAAHLKILDCNCLLEKDKTKINWIDLILDEVKRDEHVLIALRQMREICTQFPEHTYMHNVNRISGPFSRAQVIHVLENKHNVLKILTENLCQYMEKMRQCREITKKILPPEDIYPDNRFNHNQQIYERLVFLKFILKDGHYYLHSDHLKMIWNTLAEQAVYPQDREQCFRWFGEIIDEVGFEAKTARDFFQHQIMKLEPHLLTDLGMNCFERFFKSVNAQSNKFQQKRRSIRLINDEDLLGIEYLWRVIINGSDDVADRAIQLIKDIYTNISPQLKQDIKRIHQTFLHECFQRLKQIYEQTKLTQRDSNSLIRILIVLREYLSECDYSYHRERQILPMSRAFRGRPVILSFRLNTGQNRQNEDFDYACHSNETWGQIRRMIFNRCSKTMCGQMELIRNNELLHPADDNKTLAQTDPRDRIPIAVRFVQHPNQVCSSGESSSSDSEINNNVSSAHQNRLLEPSDSNAESSLPSVIFSQKHEYYQFLIDISDLGCRESNIRLRDISRQILDLVPVDQQIKSNFMACFQSLTKGHADEHYHRLKTFYIHPSPTQMLYNLKTTYIKLAPALNINDNNSLDGLHVFFLNTGGLICLLDLLTEKKFTEHCDMTTKKSIYLIIFYILKRFLLILAFCLYKPGVVSVYNESLEQILNITPLTTMYTDLHTSIAFEKHLANILQKHSQEYPIPKRSFLQYEHIIELIRLIWCLASTNKQITFDVNLKKDFLDIHRTFKQNSIHISDEYDDDDESHLACREGLELFCISLALVPSSVEQILKENFFEYFLFDLLLYCPYINIRQTISDQILTLTTRCSQGQSENLLKYLINKQFQIFNKYTNDLKQYSLYSFEFFILLCRLLSFAYINQIRPSNLDQQLDDEINWLKNLQLPIDDHLLRGHLSLAKELLQFQTSDRKRSYGIEQGLIQQLIEQYLFPASTLLYQFRSLKQQSPTNDIELNEPSIPICQSPMTISAALDFLVALGTNCLENLKLIDRYITDLFYSAPDSNLNEWDYSLPFGSRPNRGFVGLKNASATCYMNSVLQQLFMIRPLRNALLSVKIPSEYCQDEIDDDRDNFDSLSDAKTFLKDNQTSVSPPKDRNEYNIQILRQIQRIFGHLLDSKLQFYIPKEFWKIFRFAGEPVNLRDQQDAVEFLNTLVDNLDEALKTLHYPQICSHVLGGQFADQKICKDCPHRYTREEDFTLLSVDIRHSQNLQCSLELYVQGELLDGPNAYFCEKCNKKVDTIKRTCFKKLPQILAIQLKRFDYDWERETPIKFNDYFEFPRELDMEPYTVQGLAKAEGTPIPDDQIPNDGTRYKLVGIIVHKGQANGGHYYSFIQHKDETDSTNQARWYLFDDTDVTECRMDDDEELRSNCFGGEHSTSFDQPMIKKQRRWWNAYILFYEKIPNEQINNENKLSQLEISDDIQRMPLSVQRSVRKQNIKFLHNRILFSPECFAFIKRLVHSNVQYLLNLLQLPTDEKILNAIEELALICVQISSKFLFSIGWRTKKILRGQASEWTELMTHCLRASSKARVYLAEDVLFKYPNRFQEYLIDCTSAEVRGSFSRILVSLATNSRSDDPTTEQINIEETILHHLLRLIKKDIPDNVKVLAQYFLFFTLYTQYGRQKCENLIRLNVPTLFINLAIDDISSSSIRLSEPTKLYIILSTLIRCFDVSSLCKSKQIDQTILPNPYVSCDTPICSIPEEIVERIYKRENFLKKILEDANTCEESSRLLRFLLWENPDITLMVFNEIVGLLSIYYTNELRAHLDLIFIVLTIEDSWQEARILYALKGIPIMNDISNINSPKINTNHENHQSLFDIFSKSKSSYQKRAYQCMKIMLILFTNCEKAHQILQNDPEIKRRWTHAVHWLRDQLERPTNIPSNYTYFQSSGQIPSNEQSQGYFLERTPSAKSILEKATDLCSDREIDDADYNSDEIDDDEPITQQQTKSLHQSRQ